MEMAPFEPGWDEAEKDRGNSTTSYGFNGARRARSAFVTLGITESLALHSPEFSLGQQIFVSSRKGNCPKRLLSAKAFQSA
jgi:hypothetical protein